MLHVSSKSQQHKKHMGLVNDGPSHYGYTSSNTLLRFSGRNDDSQMLGLERGNGQQPSMLPVHTAKFIWILQVGALTQPAHPVLTPHGADVTFSQTFNRTRRIVFTFTVPMKSP